jgi:hypothetical protein
VKGDTGTETMASRTTERVAPAAGAARHAPPPSGCRVVFCDAAGLAGFLPPERQRGGTPRPVGASPPGDFLRDNLHRVRRRMWPGREP